MPFLNNIGTAELAVIGIVLLLLFFGSKKSKELARGLGKSSKELKKAQKEVQEALKDEIILTDHTRSVHQKADTADSQTSKTDHTRSVHQKADTADSQTSKKETEKGGN